MFFNFSFSRVFKNLFSFGLNYFTISGYTFEASFLFFTFFFMFLIFPIFLFFLKNVFLFSEYLPLLVLGLTIDVSSVVGAPWECGVLAT